MFKLIIELFGLYILYKLIFGLIIPLFQVTKQVKEKVGEMQRNMNEQMSEPHTQYTNDTKPVTPRSKNEDYIDYEEVQ